MEHVKNRLAVLRQITAILVLIVILFSGGVIARAEEPDDYENQSLANVFISLEDSDKITANIWLTKVKDGLDAKVVEEELTTGLREALQCDLKNVHFTAQPNYSFNADCRVPLEKHDLITLMRFKGSALQTRLDKLGMQSTSFSLSVPRLWYNGAPPELEETNIKSIKTYTLNVTGGKNELRDIAVAFGYDTNYLIVLAVAASVVLIVPVILILVARRRSLKLAGQDATAAWFGYWRAHRFIVEGAWLVWLIIYWDFNVSSFVEYIMEGGQPVMTAFLIIVPPGLVSFICQYLSRPLWQEVRGIAWNRREMLIRGFWEHVAAILPVVFVLIGIGSIFQNSGEGMLWFAAAAITMIFGAWMHGKTSKTLPSPLNGGELYNKILEMAERAGVKIREVFLMPTQHMQMGNAFAMSGQRVMITDYLLERLTKKEAACVMAHEIGHVKKHHAFMLSWPGFLVMFLGIQAVLYIIQIFAINLIPYVDVPPKDMMAAATFIEDYFFYPIALIFTVLLRFFLSRRFERSADEFAAILTNDPECMISSLVKLSRMNLMPIGWGRWDERLSTHPATLRRVELIAKNHRISTERLIELLEIQPFVKQGQAYDIPDEVTNTKLVFSAQRKTMLGLVNTLAFLIAAAVIPVLLATGISYYGLPEWANAAGFIVAALSLVLITSIVSIWGYGAMKRELAARLEQSGAAKGTDKAHFVGLTPEESPRHYGGHTVWDVGFLFTAPDALVFCGDKESFRIPRECVVSIEQGPSFPMLVKIPEIYVRWNNSKRRGVVHFHSAGENMLFKNARLSKLLLSGLQDWMAGKKAGDVVPGNEKFLFILLPEFPDVKGQSPKTGVSFRNISTAWIMIALIVFGLSHLLEVDSTVSWYGFGMASFCLLLTRIPHWIYREEKKQGRAANKGR